MKTIQIIAPGNARVVDRPVPKPAANEVLVRVHCCVTCPHWDISLFRGVDIFERPGYPKYPIPPGYPGHEMAGTVVAVGRRVRKLKTGDRVATLVTAGEDQPGFYAEYAARPENTLAPLPRGVSFETGASMEMSRYVRAHLKVIDVRGLRAGVVGLGPAGLIALQMLRAMGAREVVAIDRLPARLALARKLGATETINSARPVPLRKLARAPLRASVDCTGAAAGLQVAFDYTHGPVVVFGVVHGDARFGTRHWFQGTYLPRRMSPDAKDTEFVLDLWRKKQLETARLISARLPFAEYAKGIKLLMDRKAIRVAYYP
ncbi:zinc-binding dehydrogenase [bacterium]|nr:zinc-binding dehydrogenase [bacterium]